MHWGVARNCGICLKLQKRLGIMSLGKLHISPAESGGWSGPGLSLVEGDREIRSEAEGKIKKIF